MAPEVRNLDYIIMLLPEDYLKIGLTGFLLSRLAGGDAEIPSSTSVMLSYFAVLPFDMASRDISFDWSKSPVRLQILVGSKPGQGKLCNLSALPIAARVALGFAASSGHLSRSSRSSVIRMRSCL